LFKHHHVSGSAHLGVRCWGGSWAQTVGMESGCNCSRCSGSMGRLLVGSLTAAACGVYVDPLQCKGGQVQDRERTDSLLSRASPHTVGSWHAVAAARRAKGETRTCCSCHCQPKCPASDESNSEHVQSPPVPHLRRHTAVMMLCLRDARQDQDKCSKLGFRKHSKVTAVAMLQTLAWNVCPPAEGLAS
jgi:hypothetical protein